MLTTTPHLGMTSKMHASCAVTCFTTALTDFGGGHANPILHLAQSAAKELILSVFKEGINQ